MRCSELDLLATGRYSCPKLLVRDALKVGRKRMGGFEMSISNALEFVGEVKASEDVIEQAKAQLEDMRLAHAGLRLSRRVDSIPDVAPNPKKAMFTFLRHFKTVKDQYGMGRWDLVVSVIPAAIPTATAIANFAATYDFVNRIKTIRIPSTVQIDPEGNMYWKGNGNFQTMWYAPRYGQWFTSEFSSFKRNKRGELVVPTELLGGESHTKSEEENGEHYEWKIAPQGLVTRFDRHGKVGVRASSVHVPSGVCEGGDSVEPNNECSST